MIWCLCHTLKNNKDNKDNKDNEDCEMWYVIYLHDDSNAAIESFSHEEQAKLFAKEVNGCVLNQQMVNTLWTLLSLR